MLFLWRCSSQPPSHDELPINIDESIDGQLEKVSNEIASNDGIEKIKNINNDEIVEQECSMPGEECRIIVVYSDFDNCKTSEDWNEIESIKSGHSHHRLEPRRQVMRIFEKRINQAIEKKLRKSSENRLKMQSSNPVNRKQFHELKHSSQEVEDFGDESDATDFTDQGMSVRVKTRYLKNLSMEIAIVPEPLTANEAIGLSADLACIDFVSPDYVKILPPRSQSVVFELHDQNIESDDEHVDDNNLRGPPSERIQSKRIDMHSPTSAVPNDPLFGLQWHLKSNEPHGIYIGSVWNEFEGDDIDVECFIG